MLGAFLVVALVVAVIVFALISQASGSNRRRGSRHSHGHTARHNGPVLGREEIFARWQTIEAMAAGGGNGLRQAINEADKLFDHVLRQQGAGGDSMGERLKAFRPRFSDYAVYDGIWKAHKLRNALAHEVGFDLVASQARDALAAFRRGLTDLGAL